MRVEFLHRHKKSFISVMAVFCAAAAIATAGYRFRPSILDGALASVAAPFQNAATGVSRWIGGKTGYFGDMEALTEENKRLRETVDILSSENRRLKLVEQESKKLSELLQVDEKYPDYEKTGAQAIASNTSNWFTSFIINKGTRDGLAENLVVLANGGLVGRIVKASRSTSEVLAITDEGSSVSVKCVRTEDLGFLRGDLTLMQSGLCRMEFVSLDAEIMEDDELVTSHLGDIYPPGITVGYVKEVRLDDKGLTKYAIVQPSADVQNIETVLVITERYDSGGGPGEPPAWEE